MTVVSDGYGIGDGHGYGDGDGDGDGYGEGWIEALDGRPPVARPKWWRRARRWLRGAAVAVP